MRRFIAAFTVVVLAASGLTMVTASAVSARTLGPRVIRISGSTFTTTQAGGTTKSYALTEFRVRGNSSAQWPKKQYGVVFAKNQSPFGLPGGRSFRLQANYHDRSLLRNRLAFDLASKMNGMKWTPRTVFAELIVNGNYLGSYLVIEEIKIAPNRVDIPTSSGLIAEFDAAASSAGRDIDGMKSKSRDPESGTRRTAMVQNKVNPFLYHLRNNGNWQADINMASFVDYYLVREFTKDKDADFLFSNHYYASSVSDPAADIHMGPVWDFDRGAGNELGITKTTVAKPKGWWVRYHNKTTIDRRTHMPEAKNNWYNRLLTKPAFRAALCARWRAKAHIFNNVAYGGVDSATVALGGPLVAANDREVWGKSAVERPKSRGKWKKEVKYLRKWYKKRFAWMNKNICA